MSKRTGILAAVAALVVAALAAVVIMKPFTPSVVSLPQMTQQDVANADKPLVVVITSANCAGCPDVLKAFGAQVAKHPEVKFVQVDGSTVGAPAESLPAVVVIVPGAPQPSFAADNFKLPEDFDAFVTKHAKNAAEQHAALKVVVDLSKQAEEKGKVYDEQLAALQAEAQKALQPIATRGNDAIKPLQAKLADVSERLKTALGTLPQDYQAAQTQAKQLELRAKIEEIRKPFIAEAQPIQAQIAETLKPFQAEAAEALKPFTAKAESIEKLKSEALGDLPAKLEEAQNAYMQLVIQHMMGDAPAGDQQK